MTGSQLLDRAREIDSEIQAIDRRYVLAQANHAPQQAILKLEAQRNAKVREWGAVWHTKRVSP